MVSSSCSLVLLFMPIAIQLFLIPLRSYWVGYAQVKSIYLNKDNTNTATPAFCYSQLKSSDIILISTITNIYIINSSTVDGNVLLLSETTATATTVLCSLSILFNYVIKKQTLSRNTASIELINFFIFCYFSTGSLLLSGNMLNAFFSLELLGSVTLYAFFILSDYSISNASQQTRSASTSAIYQFILNFFSSLIFYTALGMLTYYHGSVALWSSTARMASNYALYSQGFICVAIAMKLGMGP